MADISCSTGRCKPTSCGCKPKECVIELVPEPTCDPTSLEAMGLYNGYTEIKIEGKKYSIGQMVSDDAGNKYMSLANCNDTELPTTTNDKWFMFKNTDNEAPVDLDNTVKAVTAVENVVTVTMEDGTSTDFTIPTDIDTTVLSVKVDTEDSNKIVVKMEDGSVTSFTRDTDNTVQDVHMLNGNIVITMEDGTMNSIPINTCDKVNWLQFKTCTEMSEYEGTDLCPLVDGQLAVVAGDEGCMEFYRYVNITTIDELEGEACGKYVGSVKSTTMKWVEYLECDGRINDLMDCVLPLGQPSLCERVTILEAKPEHVVTGITVNEDDNTLTLTRDTDLPDLVVTLPNKTVDTDTKVIGAEIDEEGNLVIHRDGNLPDIVVDMASLDDGDHYADAIDLTDGKLTISVKGFTENLSVDLPDDKHVTGFTKVGNTYKITMADGTVITTPLPTEYYVDAMDITGTTLTLSRTGGLADLTATIPTQDGNTRLVPLQNIHHVGESKIASHPTVYKTLPSTVPTHYTGLLLRVYFELDSPNASRATASYRLLINNEVAGTIEWGGPVAQDGVDDSFWNADLFVMPYTADPRKVKIQVIQSYSDNSTNVLEVKVDVRGYLGY